MKVIPFESLEGVYTIELNPIGDSRGFFMRAYDKSIFEANGIDRNWVQENHSRSAKKGIIRGLHFQRPPYTETKLVRCVKGAIMDVFVDLRKDSPTLGKYGSVILSEENKKMVLIPRGFAHGFLTLSDDSEVLYKVDNFYNAEYEAGLLWNDPEIGIEWNIDEEPTLSEKDKKNFNIKDFIDKYGTLEV